MSTTGAATAPIPEFDRTNRLVAIDAAKGISILLVVMLHLGSFWQINLFMDYVRMPLFFFTAGLFASKTLSMKMPEFLRQKVGNIFYVYAVWVVLHFSIKYLPTNILGGLPLLEQFPTFLQIVNPDGVLWFMYALGFAYLIGKIAIGFNRTAVLTIAFACYCLSVAIDQGQEDLVVLKILKLLIFFAVAVYYSREIRDFFSTQARFWPILAVFYLAGRYMLFRYPSLEIGPIPLTLSALGISAVFMFCYQFSRSKAVGMLAFIGSFSLSLYLLHGPVIFYINLAFQSLAIEKTELLAFLSLPFVVLACWLIGTRLIAPHLGFLYHAPWLSRAGSRPLTSQPAPGSEGATRDPQVSDSTDPADLSQSANCKETEPTNA